MTDAHPELGAELRQLAQAILDRLDPAVRAAAGRTAASEPGRCQQLWCPVCALAALVHGEQHPLLTVIAEHSVALLAVVRALAETPGRSGGTPEPTRPAEPGDSPEPDHDPPPPPGPGRYQHIPITIDE